MPRKQRKSGCFEYQFIQIPSQRSHLIRVNGFLRRPEDNHEDMQRTYSFLNNKLNVLKDRLYFMTGGIGRFKLDNKIILDVTSSSSSRNQSSFRIRLDKKIQGFLKTTFMVYVKFQFVYTTKSKMGSQLLLASTSSHVQL